MRGFRYGYPEPAPELRMGVRRLAALRFMREWHLCINQGGTAGIPVPMGIWNPAFFSSAGYHVGKQDFVALRHKSNFLSLLLEEI